MHSGARSFGVMFFLFGATALLLMPIFGAGVLIPVAGTLYLLLVYCNQLDARTIRDRRKTSRKSR
jgi:hypothetical protein